MIELEKYIESDQINVLLDKKSTDCERESLSKCMRQSYGEEIEMIKKKNRKRIKRIYMNRKIKMHEIVKRK